MSFSFCFKTHHGVELNICLDKVRTQKLFRFQILISYKDKPAYDFNLPGYVCYEETLELLQKFIYNYREFSFDYNFYDVSEEDCKRYVKKEIEKQIDIWAKKKDIIIGDEKHQYNSCYMPGVEENHYYVLHRQKKYSDEWCNITPGNVREFLNIIFGYCYDSTEYDETFDIILEPSKYIDNSLLIYKNKSY